MFAPPVLAGSRAANADFQTSPVSEKFHLGEGHSTVNFIRWLRQLHELGDDSFIFPQRDYARFGDTVIESQDGLCIYIKLFRILGQCV